MLALLDLLLELILKDFAAPVATTVVEDAISGRLTSPPAVLAEVHADPTVQAELQDDLESQLAAGGR